MPPGSFFQLYGSGPGRFQFDALRDAALREILAQGQSNVYDIVAQMLSEEGLAASSVVTPILRNAGSVVPPFFAGHERQASAQLKTIAQLIEGRAQTQLKRQVFFVAQNGYDTHGNQAGTHEALLGELCQGIGAFQDALPALGMTDSVTTFTLSDFGRTFKPSANGGTDHGWGNYTFVIGGAVKGGDFYGTLPVQALNGPDDLGNAGRWIPTTSLEQYGATLVRWLGLAGIRLALRVPEHRRVRQHQPGVHGVGGVTRAAARRSARAATPCAPDRSRRTRRSRRRSRRRGTPTRC